MARTIITLRTCSLPHITPQCSASFLPTGGPYSPSSQEWWSLLRVVFLVPHKLRLEAEALPTLSTVVGILSRVDPLVFDQIGVPTEALPTLSAFVGFLPGVGPAVVDQIGALAKALPTLHARVGLDAVVDPLVLDEV